MKTLDYAGLRAEIKSGKAGGGYLFCGEESYLLHASLAALKKAVFGDSGNDAFNYLKLDAASERGVDLADAITQLPVFADRRLVDLRGLDIQHMRSDALDELCGALALLADNPQTVLVICATPYEFDVSGLPKKPSKLFTRLSELIVPVVFSRETPAALAKWASAHFAHEGVSCDPAVVRALIDRVGCDMYALSGEIAKLSAYAKASGGGTVTAGDVTSMCAASAEIGAYDFSNAVQNGDFSRAFYILSELKKRRTEPVPVLADILRCYARMETVSALAEDGMSAADIAKKLKMHEFPVRCCLTAAGRLGQDKLIRALALCSDADRKLKFTSIDGYVIIYRLLASLAAL
ncbi:MAG: DNA polymerase III subunit delta [Clostridia bacterium]|nr:DNA polymerase III subunit delta [Clostridia bacterium]